MTTSEPALYDSLICLLNTGSASDADTHIKNELKTRVAELSQQLNIRHAHWAISCVADPAAAHHRRESVAGELPDVVAVFRIDSDQQIYAIVEAFTNMTSTLTALRCREREVMSPDRIQSGRIDGSMQFCSFSRPANQTHDEFMRIWWQEHTDVAIRTQSTFGYRQYEILEVVSGTFYADAIVEEHFPLEALSNPAVYFAAADASELKAHLDEMMASCDRFIDPDSINVVHMTEYVNQE